MSSPERCPAKPAPVAGPVPSARRGARVRLALVGALCGALAGCFQPLYADKATVGGTSLIERFNDVEIAQIQGRLGNDLRNALIFDLTGGAGNPVGAPMKLVISVNSSAIAAIVDTSSGLPQSQMIRVSANWRLYKAGDEKKPLTEGSAIGTASIDVSSQRFANYQAAKDAEARAGKQAAEQIKAQLAAYFIRNPGS